MSPELDKQLCAKYPELFRDRHGDMKETLMCWGFECGDGWYPLIEQLCHSLMWDGRDVEHKFHRQNPPTVVQVKEKFGGLRFYLHNATDHDHVLTGFAENLSYKICETCGTMKDVFHTEGWIRTTCKPCNDERNKEK